ncbi:hypothetical protein BH20ACT17_BH20ACT17_06890 [soil metagenome]
MKPWRRRHDEAPDAKPPARRTDRDNLPTSAEATPASPPSAGVLPAALAVSLSLSFALLLASCAVLELVGPTESAQRALYVAAFALLLPVAVLAAGRLASVESRRAVLPLMAIVAAAGFALLLLGLRLLALRDAVPGWAPAAKLVGVAALCAALLTLVVQPRWAAALARLPRPARREWPAAFAGAAVLAVLLAVFLPSAVSARTVALSLAGGALCALAHLRVPRRTLTRPLALGADLLVVALIVLAVVDLTGPYPPGQELSSDSTLTPASIVAIAQVHQSFYLGPANDVLHGRALLVDAGAVYGPGTIYVLALWFKLAPIGYGTLAIFGGLVTALQCVLGWAILRLSGCGRILTAATLLAAVLGTVLAPLGSPGLFLNVGGLRFAAPYALIVIALLAARRGEGGRMTTTGLLVAFAATSLISLELFAYSAATFLAIVGFGAASSSRSLREGARTLGRDLARGIGACVAAHVLFALFTRAYGGGWPDWGWYLAYFRTWSESELLGGMVGPWSAGWVLGGIYFASLAAVAILLAINREQIRRNAVPFLTISAGATLGAVNLSYFLSHPHDFFLPFIALPALIVGAVWLRLLLGEGLPAPARGVAVALAAWILIMVLATSFQGLTQRWPRTALAHLMPGGRSFVGDLQREWGSPPLDSRTTQTEALLERYFPSDRALVLVEPELAMEALISSGRANLLPISYPYQDQVVPEESQPRVLEAIGRLTVGTLLLVQRGRPVSSAASGTLRVLRAFRAVGPRERLSPLQLYALRQIQDRFRFQRLASGPDGLEVVRLVARA